MELTNEDKKKYLEKYQEFVKRLSVEKNYPEDVSQLLYLIVPAFVIQYGVRYENLILSMFSEISFVIMDRGDKHVQASFSRKLVFENGEYRTKKEIHLYYYQGISLVKLLDNLIHEVNHAMNSMKNEILVLSDSVLVRTGLTYLVYDKHTLLAKSKEKEYVLEEVINVSQTEKMIRLIYSFTECDVLDRNISSVLHLISQSISPEYRSLSYAVQMRACQVLLENRTFITTLENLRFQGEVQDLDGWFDMIVGKEGTFSMMNSLLLKSIDETRSLENVKWFRKRKIQKIISLNQEIRKIITVFDQNCNYK